ncbi:hypothetical protein FHW96_003163 [Novosphingobium sp. SG751A]|uniref:hypothetical protein n=1 Tax=Novosphingobium sp. SG751A TaxID=2587000 RepID=UPI001557CE8E|nr:hypothetical protein [Novosphingobium sp. SG751A]NOW46992.1 hypothetical protein [Novosphingobium sp. SG751A]
MRFSLCLTIFPLLAATFAPSEAAGHRRLPAGYHQGQCLYIADGQRRIAGKCFYKFYDDESFHIEGPRQIFDGVDYPKAETMANMVSKDFWADVWREDKGWSGYGNDDISSVHGGRIWEFRRQGACFVGEDVKVCLWRK